VQDSGGGIPEDVRERIFEPFFSTREVGAGVGLGLAVCSRIAASVGGTIAIALPADLAGRDASVTDSATPLADITAAEPRVALRLAHVARSASRAERVRRSVRDDPAGVEVSYRSLPWTCRSSAIVGPGDLARWGLAVDATYACAIAIVRRVIELEIARLPP